MDEEEEPLHNNSRYKHHTSVNMEPHSFHNTTANNDQNWPEETKTFISATTDMSHFSQENLARFPKDRLSKITCDPSYVSTMIMS